MVDASTELRIKLSFLIFNYVRLFKGIKHKLDNTANYYSIFYHIFLIFVGEYFTSRKVNIVGNAMMEDIT
jgi:hypothetical protein